MVSTTRWFPRESQGQADFGCVQNGKEMEVSLSTYVICSPDVLRLVNDGKLSEPAKTLVEGDKIFKRTCSMAGTAFVKVRSTTNQMK